MVENPINNKKCYVFMNIKPLIGRHIHIGRRLHVNQPSDFCYLGRSVRVIQLKVAGTSETESCEGCLYTQFKHLPPRPALKLGLIGLSHF